MSRDLVYYEMMLRQNDDDRIRLEEYIDLTNKQFEESIAKIQRKQQIALETYQKGLTNLAERRDFFLKKIEREKDYRARIDFHNFRKERVRELRDGYFEVTNEKVTLKDIIKAYNRWHIGTGSKNKRLDKTTLERCCEETFGDSRGKREYAHIRVFLDEEDLEEFEQQHDANQSGTD